MPSIQLKTAVPGPKSREIFAIRERVVSQGPFHITPIVAAEAAGSLITDVDGNRFLDFAAGIGVANLGHSEPSVVAAVVEQAERFLHTSFNVVAYEGYVRVAERLAEKMPGPGPHKTYLANSGAEAVENAIKFARAFTGRQAVIAFSHAYHGRTYMALALTAKAHPYKSGFAPFPAEVYRAPFPYFFRWPGIAEPPACPGDRAEGASCSLDRCLCREAFEAFSAVAKVEIGEKNVAAVIIEPVTGEGGFIPAPPPFLAMLRRWCDEHGVVLIFDEVQTGFGRTGTLFACEQLGVVPDLLALAKGLGNGMPISAVTGRAEILDAVGTGGVGGTYCGNPLACAAALAVLDKFDDPATLAHARMLGDALRKRLADWYDRFPQIGQVRGLGPMRAIELVTDRSSKAPDKPAAQALLKYCYEHGVIMLSCGTYGNAVRFLPPLTTSLEELHEGLNVVEAGLQAG